MSNVIRICQCHFQNRTNERLHFRSYIRARIYLLPKNGYQLELVLYDLWFYVYVYVLDLVHVCVCARSRMAFDEVVYLETGRQRVRGGEGVM